MPSSTLGTIAAWAASIHRNDAPAITAARKASGGKLGNPTNSREAGDIGRTTLVALADQQARSLVPALRAIQAEGILSIGAITLTFNERKVPTPRGSRRHVSSITKGILELNVKDGSELMNRLVREFTELYKTHVIVQPASDDEGVLSEAPNIELRHFAASEALV